MLRLSWREAARASLRSIISYISEHDAAAADRLLARIMDCSERLPQFPYMHRAGREPGTREAVVTPNYILVYRVTAETVEVLNVLHTRQQYP
jgi:plasmid stabilization system protein ParE